MDIEQAKLTDEDWDEVNKKESETGIGRGYIIVEIAQKKLLRLLSEKAGEEPPPYGLACGLCDNRLQKTCANCVSSAIEDQRKLYKDFYKPSIEALKARIEDLKVQLTASQQEVERLKGMIPITVDEAQLLVGLVEHSVPTDDWNINALKTCAAFYKLKAQAALSKEGEEK